MRWIWIDEHGADQLESCGGGDGIRRPTTQTTGRSARVLRYFMNIRVDLRRRQHAAAWRTRGTGRILCQVTGAVRRRL